MASISGKLVISGFLLLTIFSSTTEAAKPPKPVQLTPSNFEQVFTGEWMILFYAPWCPACKSLKPTWQSFSEQWSQDLNIKVGMVDVNKYAGLSGQFLIFSLPTVYHVKEGACRLFTGSRSQDGFLNWVNDKSWKNVDPVEWWRSPGSYQMRAVGKFFMFANFIRDLHGQLTDEYGVPSWGAYGIFALATIFVGLLVGMTLVIICDFFCPPKSYDVDDRQYSRVVVPDKIPEEQKKREMQRAAESEAAKAAEQEAEAAAAEAAEPAESADVASSSGDEQDKSVRKRKPRKED